MTKIKGYASLEFSVNNHDLAQGLINWIKENINNSCDFSCFVNSNGELLKSHNVYHNNVEFEEITSDKDIIKIFEVAKFIDRYIK